MKFDKWQQKLIDHPGHVTARCGRQTGKSTAVGKRTSNNMLKYNESITLIIAPAIRQSAGLFDKTISWLELENQKNLIKAGGFKPDPKYGTKRNLELRRKFEYDHGIYNELPTKTTIVLKKDFNKPQGLDNKGSVCYCFPAGRTGVFLRFLSLDFLVIDEAAFVPDVVYNTLKPMLAISSKMRRLGWETLLSTPFGKGGFFFESHMSDDYLKFHISAEDCKRYDKTFLIKEKKRLSKQEYTQEYLAEFTDEWNQYFPTKLIKECMTFVEWSKKENSIPGGSFYLGLDLARMGGDEVAWVIVEEHNHKLKAVKCITRERVKASHTIGETAVIDGEWKFKRIFTDSGGLGGPILDLLEEKLGKRRVIGIDNSQKRVQVHGEEKKRGIMKEDLYSNLLMLMETGRIEIINDLSLLKSLKNIQYEYTAEKKIRIYGKSSHLTEALVRACWCTKERGLNLYIN